MLTDSAGKFISQRSHKKLALFITELTDTELTIHFNNTSFHLPLEANADAKMNVTIWKDSLPAEELRAASAWFSEHLGEELHFVRFLETEQRRVDPAFVNDKNALVSFPDAYPILIISEESLKLLNSNLLKRGEEALPMNRFRPNMVVKNMPAFAELSSQTLSKNKKIETIDLAVNANILWFLGRFKKLDIRGAKETMEQMRELLQTNLILEKPFSVSMYYPKAILILYMIARAIDWGNLTGLIDSKKDIVRLLKHVKAENSLDSLLLAATYTHCGEYDLASKQYSAFKHCTTLSGGYYVLPIYSALALRFPIFYKFASWSATHIQFESDALQISLAQWVTEKIEFSS
jgi:hypothetical protein